MELANKVAFITGGVSGLGLGIAQAFLSAGMKVVITYMRDSRRDLAMKQLGADPQRVCAIRLDVTDRAAMSRAADNAERAFGALHVLCNNAGVNTFGRMDEATYEDWDWILGVNLQGVVNGLVTFIPRIKAHGEGGHIVNVASMAGMLPAPRAGIYSTSKFAVWGLTESLRDCLSPYNIGVSTFFPGLIDTKIYESHENRPEGMANTGFRLSEAAIEEWRHMQAAGMDPRKAADILTAGIVRNDRYIFSHPELKNRLRTQFNQLLDAMPDISPDTERLEMIETRRREVAKRMDAISQLCGLDAKRL